RPPRSTRFPYTTLFRSRRELLDLVFALIRHVPQGVLLVHVGDEQLRPERRVLLDVELAPRVAQDLDLVDVEVAGLRVRAAVGLRSEEHTSELQSRENLV